MTVERPLRLAVDLSPERRAWFRGACGEGLPYAPDAWYDPARVKTGYEISFTRYFYQSRPLRTLEEIRVDILALEQETEGLLDEIIGG